ncbi:MAG TPA: ATP-dependent protease, partial [Pseudomonadales bacterium]|nr:ATP-dependent protease [Pseudomonadales bacterium]
NEKIEGFFDLCKARGLDGHGVLIPRDNVQHLMLRADVVEAVRRGEFRVYGIGTIDEAIALLTGVAAGTRGADGAYPAGTVNGAVEAALTDFATARREYDAHGAAAKVAGGTAVRALSGAGDG